MLRRIKMSIIQANNFKLHLLQIILFIYINASSVNTIFKSDNYLIINLISKKFLFYPIKKIILIYDQELVKFR